jgi:hypothetical protein
VVVLVLLLSVLVVSSLTMLFPSRMSWSNSTAEIRFAEGPSYTTLNTMPHVKTGPACKPHP